MEDVFSQEVAVDDQTVLFERFLAFLACDERYMVLISMAEDAGQIAADAADTGDHDIHRYATFRFIFVYYSVFWCYFKVMGKPSNVFALFYI